MSTGTYCLIDACGKCTTRNCEHGCHKPAPRPIVAPLYAVPDNDGSGVMWENPPPLKSKPDGPLAEVRTIAPILRANPGRWARLAHTFHTTAAVTSAAHNLRRRSEFAGFEFQPNSARLAVFVRCVVQSEAVS